MLRLPQGPPAHRIGGCRHTPIAGHAHHAGGFPAVEISLHPGRPLARRIRRWHPSYLGPRGPAPGTRANETGLVTVRPTLARMLYVPREMATDRSAGMLPAWHPRTV